MTCMKEDKKMEIESEFIVPSKNEKVILNYDILDYFYMKVKILRVRNPAIKHTLCLNGTNHR